MENLSQTQFEHAKTIGAQLRVAARPIKILRSVAWEDHFRKDFIETGRLPTPEYPNIDLGEARDLIKAARKEITGDHVVYEWLDDLAQTLEIMIALLQSRGRVEFHNHSCALYGKPEKLMLDKKTRVIDLAHHMDKVLDELNVEKLVVAGHAQDMSAEAFSSALAPHLDRHFGDMAPKIILSDTLSAKAVAGSRRIQIRSSARFTERDVEQLLQHEALVHAATALNGRAQEHFPNLALAHAGTTEVQEGLAVFAEMISGAMDPVRFRRLSDRVIAIQMSIDGADFKEVYDFYHARTDDPNQAYENTRRVFRGGVLSGGAPFTKDMVYLNGLLRVHNFMRSVVKLQRADLIRILFAGKMDIEHIPALAQMANAGRLTPPRFMPHWAKDLRFLVSYMAYSSFLNQVKMPGFQSYYEEELSTVPVVWDYGT